MEAESFFARWSKRNAEAAEEKQTATAAQKPPDDPPRPPPTMEDVATLTRDSDFTPFVARGVDENVRRSAMKKLFADPHFNVMDGLDVYIEDYNTFDPIPPAMLAALNHAKGLLDPLSQLENPLMRLLQTPTDAPDALDAPDAPDAPNAPDASDAAEPAARHTDAMTSPAPADTDHLRASGDVGHDIDETPNQASHDDPV